MKLETLKLSDLRPADYNPRIITEEEFSGLKESLTTFGQQENLIVNKDMTLISGHQRYEAMKALGWVDAVCNLVDLDKHQEKKLNVLMNSQAISGKYDDLMLSEILDELRLDEDYVPLRLDKLEPLDLSEKEIEEDEAPEVSIEPPVSKLGEIYQLGRHRVMCGDSTDKASIELLMDGVKADMVFTDPPYGVDYDGINNDDRAGLESLLQESFANYLLACKSGASIYCFHSDRCADIFHSVFREYFHFSSMIIWAKNSLTLSQTDYQSQHEPCLYGWMKNGTHQWHSDRKQTSVWHSDKERVEGHTTPKPIDIVAKAVNNSSKSGDTVLDLFLGSGSTLIACEQTDRTCYGMELDPKYVDVIRKRYAKFIGKEEEWQSVTQLVDPQK